MSEELSRVKTRQKQYKGEVQSSVKAKKNEQPPASAPEPGPKVPGVLTRSGRIRDAANANASREPEKAELDVEAPPSRARTYTSERVRLSKMFVNSLILIFVILLVSLLMWGINGAPELRTLW